MKCIIDNSCYILFHTAGITNSDSSGKKNNEIDELLIKKSIQSLFANDVIVYFYG